MRLMSKITPFEDCNCFQKWEQTKWDNSSSIFEKFIADGNKIQRAHVCISENAFSTSFVLFLLCQTNKLKKRNLDIFKRFTSDLRNLNLSLLLRLVDNKKNVLMLLETQKNRSR